MGLNTTLLKEACAQLGGPVTEEQSQVLKDFQGFIAYGLREGLSFDVILRMLRHDIDGLVSKESGFLPRIKGMHAELEQMARDPEVQRQMREINQDFAAFDEKAN